MAAVLYVAAVVVVVLYVRREWRARHERLDLYSWDPVVQAWRRIRKGER